MIICGSYMHEFSVSEDINKNLTMIRGEGRWQQGRWRHIICLTLIIKELKII
jgi:hypothetical protein